MWFLIAGDDGEYHSEEALTPVSEDSRGACQGFNCYGSVSSRSRWELLTLIRIAIFEGSRHCARRISSFCLCAGEIFPTTRSKQLLDYAYSRGGRSCGHSNRHPSFAVEDQAPTYAQWSWDSKVPEMGRRVWPKGAWARHGSRIMGQHGKQSTRAFFAPGGGCEPDSARRQRVAASGCRPRCTRFVCRCFLPVTPLLLGQVLSGLKPDDAPKSRVR